MAACLPSMQEARQPGLCGLGVEAHGESAVECQSWPAKHIWDLFPIINAVI
jgi:hypothetical protein